MQRPGVLKGERDTWETRDYRLSLRWDMRSSCGDWLGSERPRLTEDEEEGTELVTQGKKKRRETGT